MRKDYNVWELAKRDINNEASTFILNTIRNDRKVNGKRKILYACIGTPRINGDSFGPMVGNILEEHLQNIVGCDSEVLGTVKNPVHAKNLEDYRDKLMSGEYFVVGIDAGITNESHSFLTLKDGCFEPGIGINNHNKEKPIKIGDISCIYNISVPDRKCLFDALQSVKLTDLEEKAVFITQAIINAELELAKEDKEGEQI